MFSDKEIITYSLSKRSSRLAKFGYMNQTIILGVAIKFVNDEQTLKHILCMSKDIHDIMRDEVLK